MSDETKNRAARAADDDQALVEALGRAAREAAARDGRGGPSPSAWYRLARSRAELAAQPAWWPGRQRAGRMVLGLAGVACLTVIAVGVVKLRSGLGGGAASRDARGAQGAVVAVEPPLTFSVQGALRAAGDEIEAVGATDTAVRFSDGTGIDLFAGARLAVTGRDANGARLRLRSGRAHFQVVHRPRAAWTVEAGPYVIEVTGTAFDVQWSETEQVVEVKMRSGSVRVSGPLLSERMPLRTGQRLVVRPAMGDVHIDDGQPAAGPARAPDAPTGASVSPEARPTQATEAPLVPAPAPRNRPRLALLGPEQPSGAAGARRVAGGGELAKTATAAPGPTPAPGAVADLGSTVLPLGESPASVSPPPPPASPQLDPPGGGGRAPGRWVPRRWAARVATGDSRAVLADAEQIGFEASLAGADSQDLSALADAARYGGRPDLADRALIEARRRFPGTARAQAAAFMLGRAADDRGDTQSGLAWYRRYLTEAPGGPYAAEALGREMLAVEKTRGREAAAPLAAEYLQRFPNGTYLLRARALLDDHAR